MLWFVHGWGFDARLWDSLRAALGDPAACLPDFGYFGDAPSPADGGGPVIAIGHSLGVMKLLRKPPTNCIGLVAINGFDRFAGDAQDETAVPRRIVERMIARFQQQPEVVLGEFRQRCGSDAPLARAPRLQPLLADLELLRDADERLRSAALSCPLLVLHGEDDAILPPAMRAAVFAGCAMAERHQLPKHGHLLPQTAASWCAGHIRAFAARLNLAP